MKTGKSKIDLEKSTREKVGKVLAPCVAELTDLMLRSKHAHWNVKGPQFIAVHEMLDDFVEDIEDWVDLVAERIVQLGGIAVGTLPEVTKGSDLAPHGIDAGSTGEHLEALSTATAAVGKRLRDAIDATEKLGDADTADICTEVSRGLDKWLWFLEAHLVEA
jgi:starvation-inducible DNA-binding protein